MSSHAAWTLALSLALAGLAPGQQPGAKPVPPAPPVEAEIVITTAEPDRLAELIGKLESALRSDDATEIAGALAPMSVHDNPELTPYAIDAMKYKASKLDKNAAKALGKELGTTSKKELAALLAEREAGVQEAAALILANFPEDKKAVKGLEKAFKDKAIRKTKPTVVAAVIRSFGRMGHSKVEKDVIGELRKRSSKEVSRACVRYLGELPTKDYRTVRMLCEMLDAPEPANVDDASNPPADYWAAQWEIWNWTRRDVTWALQQITGEVFRPADGDHGSDSKKALDFIDANRKKLGLR